MVLKRPLQISNGFWGDHHHWMFFGCLTIAINGFSMVFDFSTIAFNGFRWFWTIGQTMRWFQWIVVVYWRTSLVIMMMESGKQKPSRFVSVPHCFTPNFDLEEKTYKCMRIHSVNILAQSKIFFWILDWENTLFWILSKIPPPPNLDNLYNFFPTSKFKLGKSV